MINMNTFTGAHSCSVTTIALPVLHGNQHSNTRWADC